MKYLTPMKSIRAKCLDCSCQQRKEVRLCPVTSCALWPYRMGKRPMTSELMQVERKGAVSHAAAHVG